MGVPIKPAIEIKVEIRQGLGAGDGIVAVIKPDGDEIGGGGLAQFGDVHDVGQVSAHEVAGRPAVDPNIRRVHGAVEAQKDILAGGGGGQHERFAVPTDSLPGAGLMAIRQGLQLRGMGQGNNRPCVIVKIGRFSMGDVLPHKVPVVVEGQGGGPGAGQEAEVNKAINKQDWPGENRRFATVG